jgi:hypothetical protein
MQKNLGTMPVKQRTKMKVRIKSLVDQRENVVVVAGVLLVLIGLVLATELVSAPGPNSARSDQTESDRTEAPELRALRLRAERSGGLTAYEVLW